MRCLFSYLNSELVHSWLEGTRAPLPSLRPIFRAGSVALHPGRAGGAFLWVKGLGQERQET